MRKILIIGCVLMGSFLSAMNLPDHIKVVDHEKITFYEPKSIFIDQVLLVNDSVVSDFVLEQKNQLQPQVFAYVHDINVMDSKGFYKPVEYEPRKLVVFI